jgi:hypothetical protein
MRTLWLVCAMVSIIALLICGISKNIELCLVNGFILLFDAVMYVGCKS